MNLSRASSLRRRHGLHLRRPSAAGQTIFPPAHSAQHLGCTSPNVTGGCRGLASSGPTDFQPKPLPQVAGNAPPEVALPTPVPPHAGDAFHGDRPRVASHQDRPHDDETTPLWLTIPWVLAAMAPIVAWHTSRIERMYDPALPSRNTFVGSGKRYTAGEGALPTYASPAELAAQAQAAKRTAVQNKNSADADAGKSMFGMRLKGAEYLSGTAEAPAHTGARWDPQRRNFTDVVKDDKGMKRVPPPEPPADTRHQRLQLADGRFVNVTIMGRSKRIGPEGRTAPTIIMNCGTTSMAYELQIALAKHTRVIAYSHAELTPGPDRTLHSTLSRVLGACDFRPNEAAIAMDWLQRGSMSTTVAGAKGASPLLYRWEQNIPFPRCTSAASSKALAQLMLSDPINVTPLGALRQNFIVPLAFKYLRQDTPARVRAAASEPSAADGKGKGSGKGKSGDSSSGPHATCTSVHPAAAATVPEIRALARALRHVIPPNLINLSGKDSAGDRQSTVMGLLAKPAPVQCFETDDASPDAAPTPFDDARAAVHLTAAHAELAPADRPEGPWENEAERNAYVAVACSVADMHAAMLQSISRPEVARALSANTPLVDLSMFHAGGEGGLAGGASDYQYVFGVKEALPDTEKVLSTTFPGRLQHSAWRGDLDGVAWGVERRGAAEVRDRYGLLWGPLLHQDIHGDAQQGGVTGGVSAAAAPLTPLRLRPDGTVDKQQGATATATSSAGDDDTRQGVAWPVVAPAGVSSALFDTLQRTASTSSMNAAGASGMAQLVAVVDNMPRLPEGYDPVPIGSVPIISPARAKRYSGGGSAKGGGGGGSGGGSGSGTRGCRLPITGDSLESAVQHMITSATHGQELWHAQCVLQHIQRRWDSFDNLTRLSLLEGVLRDLAETADEFQGQSLMRYPLFDTEVDFSELDSASAADISRASSQAATLLTEATDYAVRERRQLYKTRPETAALASEAGYSDTDEGLVDVLRRVDSGKLALELASCPEGAGRLLNAAAVGGWDCLPPYVGPPPTSDAHAQELADVLNGVDLDGDDEALSGGVMLLATHYNWLGTLKFAARNVRSDPLDASTNKVSRDQCPIKGVVLVDPRMPEYSPPPPPLDAEQRMVDALVQTNAPGTPIPAVPECGLMSSGTPVPGAVLPRTSHGKSLAGDVMNTVVPSPWEAVADELGLHTGKPAPVDAETRDKDASKSNSGYGDGISWLWKGPFGGSDNATKSGAPGREVTAPLATPTKLFAPGTQLTAHAILDEVLFRDALFGRHPAARLRLGLLRQFSDTFELTGLPHVTRATWQRLSKGDPAVEGLVQAQACLAMEDYLLKAASTQGVKAQAVYTRGLPGAAAVPTEDRHTGAAVPDIQPMLHAYSELDKEHPPLNVFADKWNRGQLQSKWADWCQSGEFSSGLVSLVSTAFRPETLPFPVTVLVTSQTPVDVQARPWAHWRTLLFPFTRHGVNTLSHYPAGGHVVQARNAMMMDADQRLAVWNTLFPGNTFRLPVHPSLVREPWEYDTAEASGFVRKLMLGAVEAPAASKQ